MVASLLRGYNPNLSPLFQQPTFSPPLNQQFTIPPQPTVQAGTSAKIGLGRRLLQDNLAVRFLAHWQMCSRLAVDHVVSPLRGTTACHGLVCGHACADAALL